MNNKSHVKDETIKMQKLSIYLLKGSINNTDAIVTNYVNALEIAGGKLYYKKSEPTKPSWLIDFFGINDDTLVNTSVSGLYIKKIKYEDNEIFFALAFGHGWQMLKANCIEEQFGLKTVLGIMEGGVKQIGKKTIRFGLRDIVEQSGKYESVEDFSIDTDDEVVLSIVAKVDINQLYSEGVSGKDSISINYKKKLNDIDELLKAFYKTYVEVKKNNKYEWFDKIKSIDDVQLINKLDEQLVDNIIDIKKQMEKSTMYKKIALVIPEVINWEKTKGYSYTGGRKKSENIYTDMEFSTFLEFLPQDSKKITKELLRYREVHLIDVESKVKKKWSIYKCLSMELDHKKNKYLLISGKYFQIDASYVAKIEQFTKFDELFDLVLPNWNQSIQKDDKGKIIIKYYEDEYNAKVAKDNDELICLDAGVDATDKVWLDSRDKQFEIADLVHIKKYFIYVKNYVDSSPSLSHLFTQGLNAAVLLMDSKEFRDKSRNIIKNEKFKDLIPLDQFATSEYTIVFAIGTLRENFQLPFMSKVCYYHVKKDLIRYHYKVKLIRIKQVQIDEPK